MKEYDADEVDALIKERDALAVALRCRVTGLCKTCGYLQDGDQHWPNCKSYQVEKNLLTQ
jgi:hypothetical protein